MRSLYVGELVEVADTSGWGIDVDTPDDLRRVRTRVR
jgi:CTP:molybdopterin cytidylyltransferase MocA